MIDRALTRLHSLLAGAVVRFEGVVDRIDRARRVVLSKRDERRGRA